MGTEITTTQEAGSLTLALTTLAQVTDERDLTDEQFTIVASFADAPSPAIEITDDDHIRNVVGALASTLKAAKASTERGKFQLGMYRKALAGTPKATLAYAGERAIRELEWMPTPVELLQFAKHYHAPEHILHQRAKRITRDRRQRIFEQRCKALRDRTFPTDQFHTLTEQEISHGLANRGLLQELDGTLIPWSLTDHNRINQQHHEAMMNDRKGVEPHKNEPPFHARDLSGGSVGEAAAGVLDGVEVED